MKKRFKWSDLKRIVNKMDKKSLDNNVTIWGEERSFLVDGVLKMKEDYLDDGDTGTVPRSECKKNYGDDYKDYKDEVVYEKGTHILLIDECLKPSRI